MNDNSEVRAQVRNSLVGPQTNQRGGNKPVPCLAMFWGWTMNRLLKQRVSHTCTLLITSNPARWIEPNSD